MELTVLIMGATLVGFAVGVSGFADALIASAIWLYVLAPIETVPLIYLTGIVVHSLSLVALRQPVVVRRLFPFVAGGVVGTPLGLWALGALPPEPITRAVGALLVVLGTWQIYRYWRLLRAGAEPESTVLVAGDGARAQLADGTIGAAGGFLGGLSGVSGVLPTLWSAWRGWAPGEQRGVYQPFILLMHLWGIAGLVFLGAWPSETWARFAWCLGPLLGGLLLGVLVYRWIDQRTFRLIVLGLIVLCGLGLLA